MINHWLTASDTLIIGHRGASAFAPENTMFAFHLAQKQGADGLEFDIHLSSDGVPMVIHDHTLDRTTNATGDVGALTCVELQALDAGRGEGVPTLAQVFEAFGRNLLYNVEIKEYGARSAECVAAIAQLIKVHDLAEYITVSSFEYAVMELAQQQMPANTAIALLRMPNSDPIPEWFAGQADHPWHPMIDSDYMRWAQANELRVHTWTVDDPNDVRRLSLLGVHALISNKPAFIRAVVDDA